MRRYTVKMTASFEDAVALVMAALQQRGFRVVRSFDLASALDPDDPACSCPHHGTDRCTCRYTVLLVYGPVVGETPPEIGPASIAPRSVTIHARDAETHISLSRFEPWPESRRVEATTQEEVILQGLVEASLATA